MSLRLDIKKSFNRIHSVRLLSIEKRRSLFINKRKFGRKIFLNKLSAIGNGKDLCKVVLDVMIHTFIGKSKAAQKVFFYSLNNENSLLNVGQCFRVNKN